MKTHNLSIISHKMQVSHNEPLILRHWLKCLPLLLLLASDRLYADSGQLQGNIEVNSPNQGYPGIPGLKKGLKQVINQNLQIYDQNGNLAVNYGKYTSKGVFTATIPLPELTQWAPVIPNSTIPEVISTNLVAQIKDKVQESVALSILNYGFDSGQNTTSYNSSAGVRVFATSFTKEPISSKGIRQYRFRFHVQIALYQPYYNASTTISAIYGNVQSLNLQNEALYCYIIKGAAKKMMADPVWLGGMMTIPTTSSPGDIKIYTQTAKMTTWYSAQEAGAFANCSGWDVTP